MARIFFFIFLARIYLLNQEISAQILPACLWRQRTGKEFVEWKGTAGSNRVAGKREGYLWYPLKVGYVFILSSSGGTSLTSDYNGAELRRFDCR